MLYIRARGTRRTGGAEGVSEQQVQDLTDLAAEGGSVRLDADSEVALRKNGPFERLAVAMLDNFPAQWDPKLGIHVT